MSQYRAEAATSASGGGGGGASGSYLTLATCSAASPPTLALALRRLSALATAAASSSRGRARADVLLLPEAFVGGYPRGSTFGSSVGARSARGRDEFLRYWGRAADLGDWAGEGGAGGGDEWIALGRGSGEGGEGEGGAATTTTKQRRGDGTREEMERIARDTGVFLVVGVVEKAGGSLYCSVVYVCPRLGVVGKRRKVMPTGTERLIWAQGSASTLRAVSTVIRGVRVNLAAAICWESYMPLLRQSLYAQNVNLYLAPTADGRDTWLALMRTVAIEGRTFVVSANMCVRGGEEEGEGEKTGATEVVGSDGGKVATTTTSAIVVGQRRRRSLFTPEGHEIVLCPGDPYDESEPSPTTNPAGPDLASAVEATPPTSPKPPQSPITKTKSPRSSPSLSRQSTAPNTARRRRRSFFNEYGHEIVICAGEPEPGEEDAAKKGEEVVDAPPPVVELVEEETTTTEVVESVQTKKGQVNGTNGNKAASGAGTAVAKAEFLSRGGSCIIAPTGEVLAGPQWEDDEGIIYARVDFDDCIRGRLDLDVAGSYSRSDAFKLSVAGLDLKSLPY